MSRRATRFAAGFVALAILESDRAADRPPGREFFFGGLLKTPSLNDSRVSTRIEWARFDSISADALVNTWRIDYAFGNRWGVHASMPWAVGFARTRATGPREATSAAGNIVVGGKLRLLPIVGVARAAILVEVQSALGGRTNAANQLGVFSDWVAVRRFYPRRITIPVMISADMHWTGVSVGAAGGLDVSLPFGFSDPEAVVHGRFEYGASMTFLKPLAITAEYVARFGVRTDVRFRVATTRLETFHILVLGAQAHLGNWVLKVGDIIPLGQPTDDPRQSAHLFLDVGYRL